MKRHFDSANSTSASPGDAATMVVSADQAVKMTGRLGRTLLAGGLRDLTPEQPLPHIGRLDSWEREAEGPSGTEAAPENQPPKGLGGMPLVKVKENESIDKAIRRFKKKCEKEGIIQDIKKSSRYLKPSERKRKKALKAAKRRRSGKA